MPDAPASIVEKCQQINIASLQDARSCIRNLQRMRDHYIAHGCTAIEACVYSGLENDFQVKDLSQNFRWCKTFRKIVAPFEGNVLFPIPHFEESAWAKVSELQAKVAELEAKFDAANQGIADAMTRHGIERNADNTKRKPGRPKTLPRTVPLPDPVSSDV